MSEFNITVDGGTSKRLLTAGKYCDRDIVITAEGGEYEIWTITYIDGTIEEKKVVVL